MTAVLCLDNNNGMMFNNRRQSRDRVLIQDLLDTVDDCDLYMSEYSVPLFPTLPNIHVSETPETTLQSNDFYFFEKYAPLQFEECIDRIIVYRWNRDYPADTYCDIDFSSWNLAETTEIQGSSHTITKEVYVIQ